MHGAGNDFIVLNGIDQDLSTITKEEWRQLAHRQFGIGADQILLIEKAIRPDADFRYRIFNSDGGEVEQCGNGSRCFVRYVLDKKLSSKNPLRVEVAHMVLTLEALPDGQVQVDMGAPIFEHDRIPFRAENLASKKEFHETLYALPIGSNPGGHDDWIGVLSMGNPHAVQVVMDVDSAPVAQEGPFIESHPAFPHTLHRKRGSVSGDCTCLRTTFGRDRPLGRQLQLWFRPCLARRSLALGCTDGPVNG